MRVTASFILNIHSVCLKLSISDSFCSHLLITIATSDDIFYVVALSYKSAHSCLTVRVRPITYWVMHLPLWLMGADSAHYFGLRAHARLEMFNSFEIMHLIRHAVRPESKKMKFLALKQAMAEQGHTRSLSNQIISWTKWIELKWTCASFYLYV